MSASGQVDPRAAVSDTVRIRGVGRLDIGPFARIEDWVVLDTGTTIESWIRIAPRAKLKHGTIIRTYDGWVSIGSRTTIGEYTVLAGHGGLSIEDTVIIAGHCYLSAANHMFESEVPIRFQGETAKGIRIEQGAWLGAGVIVLDGVTVGRDSIVAAGSVVTRNLPPAMLCLGSPCRALRPRHGRV